MKVCCLDNSLLKVSKNYSFFLIVKEFLRIYLTPSFFSFQIISVLNSIKFFVRYAFKFSAQRI